MSRHVLVTGAGSGFGRAASLALADRGHRVIATTETDEQAEDLRSEAPGLTVERLDITTRDVDKVNGWELDVLVNNAAVAQTGPLADIPLTLVRRTFEVNVFGTLALTQAVLAGMVRRGGGRVIIVSSIMGVRTAPAFGPYAMTKHALEAMAKSLRAEMAPLGVDVTLLNPGPYRTGFNDRMVTTMWEWYDDDATTAPARAMYEWMRGQVGGDQGDPAEVVERIVELVEAETTAENNFVPPDIIDRLESGRS